MVPLFAQEPAKVAPVLNIDRESIKEGKGAAHEKLEADWAAVYRKANFPGHYYAIAAISGPGQVWFLQPMASFAAGEELEKAGGKEPLKSALESIEERDGEVRSGSRALWAVYRPDLSYKPESFNIAKTRYMKVQTIRVNLGKEGDFPGLAKDRFSAYAKAGANLCVLAYEVTAGEPAGTYLFFQMMDSMKALDVTPEIRNLDRQMAFSVAEFIEDNLFEVKPAMSYPPKNVLDADPGFWKPKTVEKKSPQ
jgi:hypothetical protein